MADVGCSQAQRHRSAEAKVWCCSLNFNRAAYAPTILFTDEAEWLTRKNRIDTKLRSWKSGTIVLNYIWLGPDSATKESTSSYG